MDLTRRKLPLTFLLFFFILLSKAQTATIDSLRNRFLHVSAIEEKKQVILEICRKSYSLSADTLLKYVNIGHQLFKPGSREYLRMRNYYCIHLFKLGKIKEGLLIGDSLAQLVIREKNVDRTASDILGTRCGGLIRNGQNKDAIKQGFEMLQYAEPVKDTLGIINSYNLLGWANMELEQYADAIKWFNKAIAIASEPLIIERGGVLYANNASCYNNINKPDSAFYFIGLALKYSRIAENLTSLANSLNIRADMFINKKDYVNAEKDMMEALEVRKHLSDPIYVISDMAQLSFFYASINETDKGIAIAENGIEIAEKANNLSKLIFLYTALGENYKKANRLDKYSGSLETVLQLKDSLYKNNSTDAIAEMEAKYELQKKENIIIKQNYALTRNQYITIGTSVFFVLSIFLFWALYRNYRLSQKRKMELAMAEQKLLSYKAVELAEEKERKRIAADLHDNLGSYAAAITANVKTLKDENSNEADAIMAQLDENAQNMVTQLGDTIWVLKNEQLPITKLADRFKAWTQRLIQNYPQVKYHYSENIIDDVEFTPAKILHIFLILKECVNNALKHSNCTDLVINFFSDEHWVISIEDNGIGFIHNGLNAGDGINNIKSRAEECGWHVQWESINPAGTLVIISETTTK